jgi:hypothetical protein
MLLGSSRIPHLKKDQGKGAIYDVKYLGKYFVYARPTRRVDLSAYP